MGVLIDASLLIAYERGGLNLEERLRGREHEQFLLSVITASELLHGVHRARNDAVRARRGAWVEAVLGRFPLLPIDLATARAHARLWAELAMAGACIGPHDMWLAASCLANGLSIATANVREFARVPGLVIDEWRA